MKRLLRVGGWVLSSAALTLAAVPQAAVAALEASATLFPSAVDFGEVPAGGASGYRSIDLRNTGRSPFGITGISATGGNFDLRHDCPVDGGSLDPGTYCRIDVRFSPASEGSQAGTLRIERSSSAAAIEIPLGGKGVAPGTKVLSADGFLAFPDTVVGATSGPLAAVFTNTGSGDIYTYSAPYVDAGCECTAEFFVYDPLILGGLKASRAPAFGASKATPASKGALPYCEDLYYADIGLYPGDSCLSLVWFRPADYGDRSADLVIQYDEFVVLGAKNAGVSVVRLVGTGVPEANPDIAVSASSVAFGSVVVRTSSSRTITVTSTGTGPLQVYGVRTFNSVFSATTDCTASQPPGSVCNVTVTCTPTSLTSSDGDLYIDHNASGGFSYVRLACTGVPVPVPKIEVTPAGVGFGDQTLGTTSASQRVLIKSVGSAPLAVQSVAAGLPFSAGSNCPAQLPPGSTCSAVVSFTPGASGGQQALLQVGSNDPDRPIVSVNLTGTGCRPFSLMAARRGVNLCGP